MTQEQMQHEMRELFLSDLRTFIAQMNFVDEQTPGGDLTPPHWWLLMSELRRKCVNVRDQVSKG